MFLASYRPDLVGDTFTLQTLNGGVNLQDVNLAGDEADLDIQYTVGVASGVPTSYISVGTQSTDDFGAFLDTVNFLLGQDDPPKVLSTSYNQVESAYSFALTK